MTVVDNTSTRTAGGAGGPMIEVHEVSRTFRSGGSVVAAVREVSLTVGRGEFLAIVGRSGSGKTTLLNLIAGLDRPDRGSVIVEGQEISAFSESQMTEFRRHTVGFVFQSFGLLPLLSAEENIELALRIAGAGIRERGERTRELLRQVGLTERADHRPYELSGGEQQRVAVARALANRPPLLIADEPTGELDSTTGAQIFQLLREVTAQGVTVVTATHDPFVMQHADRVLEMADGRLLGDGEGGLAAAHRAPDAPTGAPPGRPPARTPTRTPTGGAYRPPTRPPRR